MKHANAHAARTGSDADEFDQSRPDADSLRVSLDGEARKTKED